MRIHEIINENEERSSIWALDDIVEDDIGGIYRYMTRVNQFGNIDGFALVYINPYINPIKNPDGNVVVSYSMNPRKDSEIIWYDYSIHRNGRGVSIGNYRSDDDLDHLVIKFLNDVKRLT